MKIKLLIAAGVCSANALGYPEQATLGKYATKAIPPPPPPEPISITRVPLPPVAPNSTPGSCSAYLNPRRTGCIAKVADLQSGNFFPDDSHLTAIATFAGAPASPDPAFIYDGQHVILLKTDGSMFPNGDSWKCVTCGVSQENSQGRGLDLGYPQSFRDGRRILAGTNIIQCEEDLASEACTPEKTRIIPLRWDVRADGSGQGGAMRELRIHPDNVHIGFSSFTIDNGVFGQFSYFGRITYNPDPTVGEPLVPRYDVVNVSVLYDSSGHMPVSIDPSNSSKLVIRDDIPTIGELRGFSGTGQEVTYIGNPTESSNMDVFAAHLVTGKVRRLTAHPEYVDPVDISPDDKWHIVMDTRGTDRQMFLSGLRGIPPLTDLVTAGAVSSTRNNGQRRFFIPWLIDYHGDRGSYSGQRLNNEGSGRAGSGDINDPEWNGKADPKWSWDGTRIAYTQIQTIPPACEGGNPLPCYTSKEEGGRAERIMIAHLSSREPLDYQDIEPVSDVVPWGTPFPPGASVPSRPSPPLGTYTLDGKFKGWANVSFIGDLQLRAIETVSVVYHDFSDDGVNVLSGSERVTRCMHSNPTLQDIDWYSNLTQTGPNNGTKLTGREGFRLKIDIMTNIFEANGTLITTVDREEYVQPANGT